MDEQRAKEIIGARIALDIIRAKCTARQYPDLRHTSQSIIKQDLHAAEALGFSDQVHATIGRVCGLNCKHCATPMQ